MACGFLVLRDGRCLSVRWRLHDSVLRSIARALAPADPLRAWLLTQLPREDDHELGFAFVRADDGVHVSRHIDTRCLHPDTLERLEMAARLADPSEEPFTDDVKECLARLSTMLAYCDEGRPPLDLSDWTVIEPPDDARIGPGWPERSDTRVPCPACGFRTLADGYGSHDICVICDWEDDGVQLANPTSGGGANRESLAEAQAAILERLPFERKTHLEHHRDPQWRPLNAAELADANARRTIKHWHSTGVTEREDAYWLRRV